MLQRCHNADHKLGFPLQGSGLHLALWAVHKHVAHGYLLYVFVWLPTPCVSTKSTWLQCWEDFACALQSMRQKPAPFNLNGSAQV